MRKFLEEGKYDILHTHNFSAGLWGRLAALSMGKNRPVLVHTEHGRRGNITGWRKWLSCYLARRSDRIISVSDETRDYLIEQVKLNPDNVIVLKNGIDLDYLLNSRNSTVKEIGDILKKNAAAKFVVNVSALSEVKDHATLLRAFKILKNKYPAAYLLLVGDGPLRLDLHKLALALEISDDVVFMGERHDIAAILDKSDIFVLSSRNEGHPISLLEAMGMGVVPVATDVGGIPELIENTVNGLTVPPGEPSMLADAIRIALENDELYEQWSVKSRELVLNHYTAKVMAKRHEELYSELVNV
ncbi:MAG: glycosyltransferase [bacterium]